MGDLNNIGGTSMINNNNNDLNTFLRDNIKPENIEPIEKQVIIIMGVSGSGKTTIGKELASKFNCNFNDADEFHSQENKNKMKEGIPLTDEDREPWLQAINKRMIEFLNSSEDNHQEHIFSCSALKSKYRDTLSANINKDNILFILLQGDKSTLSDRLNSRKDHFFNPSLLDSQLSTLELPLHTENNHFLYIDIKNTIDNIIDEILNYLK